ncbi:MAG TPA: ribonuclease Z [Thermodesulfobacteriota bacterium]|nr:ribonuclease Z [Thermodesulfobacteriota bacterium]
MKVILLGTGGAIPTLRRSLPALALQRDGDIFLFDCGEGTQVQIIRASLSPGKLFAIFLSHLHGDHVTGLPGLLMTIMHQSREKPLRIFGPPGTREYIALIRKCLGFSPPYVLDIREVTEGKFFYGSGFRMEAVAVDHRLHTLAFSLVEEPRPGRFFPEKAKDLGIPEGPLFGKLQRGETVTLADGRNITPSMVMSPPRKGRKFVYATDTRPCLQVIKLAQEADLLVHEGMFAHDMEEEAKIKGHSTCAQAAQIASEAKVKNLIITHISTRYQRTDELLYEARTIFPNAIIGQDLMTFEIPIHKE